jgi:hypothetical protein
LHFKYHVSTPLSLSPATQSLIILQPDRFSYEISLDYNFRSYRKRFGFFTSAYK